MSISIIETEVNNIINSINDSKCYYYYNYNTQYTITGLNDIIKIIDYTYMIPNLFRKCFVKSSINLPDICVNYIYNDNSNNNSKYLPILLNETYIKSFLYYNFPVNIKYYKNNTNFLNNVIQLKKLIFQKTSNTSYGSYTLPYTIFNSIYSNNSMLVQLLNFNYNLLKSVNYINSSKINCSYVIPWDYTTECYDINTQYIIENIFNLNNIITSSTFYNLNTIQNSYYNIFTNTNINSNDILFVFKSNILIILQYANEVYRDILNKIDYLIRNVQYCDKDYMNINNIPILIGLYNNFYNNQLYVNQKYISTSSSLNLSKSLIQTNKLITNFETYINENNMGKIINKIIINNKESIIIYYSNDNIDPLLMTESNYNYYYLNINNPSPIKLNNSWKNIDNMPNYTDMTISIFSNDFLYEGSEIGSNKPYLIKSKSKNAILIETLNTNQQIYYTYNDINNKLINSKILLTFQTILNCSIGLALVYYKK